MKKLTVASLSLSFLLVGCTGVNNEGIGALSGGVVGGLLGSQFGSGGGKVAAAAGGALIGAVLGGQIGRSMDKVDQMQMQRALETAPTGRAVNWSNPDTGYRYTVQPVRTYYRVHHHERLPCREYTTKAWIDGRTQLLRGSACRQPDGSWHVVN
ncbi:RT0821/Lpp0805 family surface protein [Legionella saoudiensis]|uniref:RT0821/Lpp0805 family surface protein n=1 Tax=Legionella saoudiensis TaxID=1750561 RepID=UPI00073015FA|nr:RT0821/Lpp0805 family surface protein [Legionella saoudiensis]